MAPLSPTIRHISKSAIFSTTVCLAFGIVPNAIAEDAGSFYAGKQLTVLIGSSAGGGYDAQGRLMARYIGKHIPGKPKVIVQNMPGAGGIAATNFLYNKAPKDGTAILLTQREMLTAKLVLPDAIHFDVSKLNWIGNLAVETSVIFSWHTSSVTKGQDLFDKELIVGGMGPTVGNEAGPRLFNALIGTKFRIVSGYPGTAEILIAMERGEIEGIADYSWSNLIARKANYLADKKINVLMQIAPQRIPELPDVPAVLEFAKSDLDREVIGLFVAGRVAGRPVAAPPDIPLDRTNTLRAAFDAMSQDDEFKAQAAKLDIGPTSSAEVDNVIQSIASSSDAA